MSSLCFLGSHEPRDKAIFTNGCQVSTCRRCGRTMIRSTGEWRTMPRRPYDPIKDHGVTGRGEQGALRNAAQDRAAY